MRCMLPIRPLTDIYSLCEEPINLVWELAKEDYSIAKGPLSILHQVRDPLSHDQTWVEISFE